MVRLVPCGVRKCRQAAIDGERERERDRDITIKKEKEGRTIV